MRVAIYCRVSTDEQNIEQQRQFCIEYCNRFGYNFRTYKDEAISGLISDRPEWLQLLKDCEEKKFDMLLVSKWDRITRDLRYAIDFLEWLKPKEGLKLMSIYDGDMDFSPDKVFQFKLKCLLSEYELAVLKWRSRIGIERAKLEGKYKGGKKGRTWGKVLDFRGAPK